MKTSPFRTFLIYLILALVVLSAGLVLRQLIVNNFDQYTEAARQTSTGGEAREHFVRRTTITVLTVLFLLSGLVLVLARIIIKKPAHPVAKDEEKIRKPALAKAHVPKPESAVQSPAVPETTAASAVKEDERPATSLDDVPEEPDEDMQPLARDGDRISKVVKGLDELARAQALGRALNKQPVELQQYLNNIIETTRSTAADKDVVFNVECESSLSLSADPECLAMIITNVLDNAVKAVKHSGTITVSSAVKDGHVVFAVKDTGAGISKKALPHVFEQFYRGSGNGIGLGLTIVKELVNACGGTVEVQSARGIGTTVTVSLPVS